MTTLNALLAAEPATTGRTAAGPAYPDGAAELAGHLLRLNGLLSRAVARFRGRRPAEQRNGLDGVAIFDDEIDRFLASAPGPTDTGLANTGPSEDTQDRRRGGARAAASAELGVELPVDLVRRRFKLSDLEVDALLHCVAAELHPGYGRVFAYLNNDLTRARPSIALILEVLCPGWAERLKGRRELSPRSALFFSGLLTARPGTDHLTADLEVDPVVLDFVLGGGPVRDDDGAAAPGLDDLVVSPDERAAARQVTGYLGRVPRPGPGAAVVVISGPPGVGRRTCAEAICRDLGWRLRPLGEGAPAAAFAAGVTLWLRDARLLGEVPGLYVPPGADDEPGGLSLAVEAAAADGGPAFVFVAATWSTTPSPRARMLAPTARTSRLASPLPRADSSVQTALISVHPGRRIRSPAMATRTPSRRTPR